MAEHSETSDLEKGLLIFLRLAMGWTFLWAAIHHFGDNAFVPGFLRSTKTFHAVYAPMAAPGIAGVLTFFVEYGHLLIGLSLVSGLLVRASAPFAILIMILYWTAHMDFPYIEDANSFLIDYHLVYAAVLILLIMKRAGHLFGLDAWAAEQPVVQGNATLRWLVG